MSWWLDLKTSSTWQPVKLGKLLDFQYGKALKKNDRNNTGDYPVYGSNGIVGYHDSFLIEAPALLVGRKGAVGEIHIAEENFWPIDTTYFVKLTSQQNLKFTYYLLKHLRLEKLDRSTAIPGLNRDDAYDQEILLPPTNEQTRIVEKIEELFSELDKGVESLKTAQQQLKVYRQALLKQAFEGKLTEQWRKDAAQGCANVAGDRMSEATNPDKVESAEQLLARIKAEREARYQQQLDEWKGAVKGWDESSKENKKPTKPKQPKKLPPLTTKELEELPALPEGWCWVQNGHLLLIPVSNGRSVKDKAGGFPVLRLTALKGEIIDLSETKEGDWSIDEAKPFMVKEGDFLVARGNGSLKLVGKGGLVPYSQNVAYPDTMIRLRLDSLFYKPQLFAKLWNSAAFRQQIEKSARTTAGIYKINQDHINNYRVPVPPIAEQEIIYEAIERRLSVVEQLEIDTKINLKKSEALRQSILKKAFSGQLVPQDPSDEPTSVLLERIQAERKAAELAEKQAKAEAKKATQKRKPKTTRQTA